MLPPAVGCLAKSWHAGGLPPVRPTPPRRARRSLRADRKRATKKTLALARALALALALEVEEEGAPGAYRESREKPAVPVGAGKGKGKGKKKRRIRRRMGSMHRGS